MDIAITGCLKSDMMILCVIDYRLLKACGVDWLQQNKYTKIKCENNNILH